MSSHVSNFLSTWIATDRHSLSTQVEIDRADSPFFVVGCPRSGTTLLSVLLDRHSRLSVPPETGFFDEIAPRLKRGGTDNLLRVLQGWRRLPELGLTPEDVLDRVVENPIQAGRVLSVILQLYGESKNKPRCGEKTPHHLKHVPAILKLFPQAKVLCMLRDGRDVSLSLQAMPWWAPNNLTAAATLWKRSLALALRYSHSHTGRFRIVRYEDLVANPDGVMRDAMKFLGEVFEPTQLDPAISGDLVLPRSIEWKGQALQPVSTDYIGKRRRDASPEDVALLERLLQRDLVQAGYL